MQSETISINDLIKSYKKLKPSQTTLIWQQLVKWIFYQYKSDHHVVFGKIGTYGFKIEEKTYQKIPILFFNQSYLKEISLQCTSSSFILKPLMKINSNLIANNCNSKYVAKEDVEAFMDYLYHYFDQCFKNTGNNKISVDLDILGKISKNGNQISFQYKNPLQNQRTNSNKLNTGKPTLRVLVEKQGLKTQYAFNKMSLLHNKDQKEVYLPKIQKNNKNIESDRDRPSSIRKRSSSKERKLSSRERIQSSKRQLAEQRPSSKQIKQRKNTQKPIRSISLKTLSYNKKDALLGSQMMGAGNDPLKKQHDYAKLISDPKQLMKTTFIYKKSEAGQNIPIIDSFSRTLACPIATQRQNPLVAARIGSNLSLSSQSFQITSQGIKNIKIKADILESRIPKSKTQQQFISQQLQYSLIIKQIRTPQQNKILDIRRKYYQGYIRLFDHIEQKHICQLKKQTISNILKLIDQKYQNYTSIAKMIDQIYSQYVDAVKKSIIDYILMDTSQCQRLSLYIKYKTVPLYGTIQSNYSCYNPKSLYKMYRDRMNDKIMKNSQYFVIIQRIWCQKYQNLSLIDLPQELDPYLHIDDFLEMQKLRIKQTKDMIINSWMPILSNIYRDQINQLDRNQGKCVQFFQTAATFLSIQIRGIIYKAMQSYKNFINKFDKQILNPPDTVVYLQKISNRYQTCFLNARISHRKDQIYFMDDMKDIQTKLLTIIDLLRQFSQMIPRPQNLITKTDKLFITEINKNDQYYLSVRKYIEDVTWKNLQNTIKALQIFNQYRFLLIQNRVIQSWILTGKHDRRQYAITFQKYTQLYHQVMDKIPSFIRMNMVNIDSSQLKHYLLKCTEQIIQKMQKSVFQLVYMKNNQIKGELEKIISVATMKISDCQQLVYIENQVDMFRRNGIQKLQQKNQDLVKWITTTLYNTLYPPSKQDLQNFYNTSNFLQQIYQKLDKQDATIFAQRKKLEQKVKQDNKYYNVRIKQLIQNVEKLKEFGSRMLKESALELLKENRSNTTYCVKFIENLNERERLLGMDQTVSEKVYEIDKVLKPFQELWNLVKDYQVLNLAWTRDSIFKLNAESIDFQVKKMYKLAVQLSNSPLIMKTAPLTIKVAEQLVQQIQSFQKNIPIISVFSNPGLKQRHFTSISQLIKYQGQQISRRSNLYLNKLLSMNVNQYIDQLQNISETATKQYIIETTINKIKTQWQQVIFEMKQYKDTDVKILTGSCLEDIQVLLDDHSLKMITIKGSLHAKIFQEELNVLDQWLEYTNVLIQYSVKVQSIWMYLEPVMTSPDILKHLSVEGTKFKVVDEIWRVITKIYADKLKVKEITKNKKIVEQLKQSYANLQIVVRGLNSYLQSKRISFPRFFFLSNQQLLQILSQTKNPKRVQPHLKKCFEGISRLQFEDEKVIQGMYSDQSQYVQFPIKINTNLARGNVDQWLLQVQNRMIRAVKNQIKKSHQNYQIMQRKQSLFLTCAMSILTVQMTNWTKNTQQNIQQCTLNKAVTTTEKNLKETVELIKDYKLLRKIDIITLQALIVLSVHNLDIVNNLAKKNVRKLDDFQWQSQLRYYYREFQEEEMKTQVKILNAVCEFNHQYLGNTSRLVITPLTDRCYRTLCSAIFLNYGGAPQGPAGTGKTQTVKDLAKALACQCVVFNCSDGLDYKAMGKFFKGLAASGAWSCFDQFNRIDLQVLSVVAQQILSIQNAKARCQKVVFFEDAQIKLKKNANCFITMNPGYAGRSQLPDNLKALFRSVAMMIPDYAMIAQISLYSYGFTNARNLARKIVSTYKLCSEQLSSQQHYDYGMRAVKSVLVAAGNLKRKYPQIQQSSLVLKAINDVNVAKFLHFDIPLFNGITSDLFKQIQPPKINYEILIQKIIEIYEQCNLSQSDYSLQKIIQIYDMILVRHGLMIVGDPFSGKTTSLQVLAQALKRVKQQMNENQVEMCKINPKSITMRQLYGYFDDISHEWFDGVLAVKFRNFATTTTNMDNGQNNQNTKQNNKNKENKRKWLILDGPVDALWIQNMNTVLDDNKKLCLSSGEIIAMSKTMSLIFQPMDLLAASPATVSRCGMIYMQPNSLGLNVFIDSWLRQHSWLNLQLIKTLKQFLNILPSLFSQIKSTMKTICHTQIFTLTHTLLKILSSQLQPIKTMMKSPQGLQQLANDKNSFKIISSIFIFSCIWSFGACVETKSRRLFDYSLKKIIIAEIMIINKSKKLAYPQKGLLYDYIFIIDCQSQHFDYQWKKWSDMISPQKPPKTQLHKLKIITPDTIKYNYILQFCINNKIPLLLCGPTGTGKTTLIKSYKNKLRELENVKNSNQNQSKNILEIVFSSRTSCSQVYEQIDAAVDKKGAKNIVGPKQNMMVIYVDDVNMPIKEKYGAQPPIQFLRQLVDQKGFYDFKEKQKIFKKIIDVTYVYCMSALNNDVSPRFLRHSYLLSMANFDDDTLIKIFSTILSYGFEGSSQHKHISTILRNSIQLYNQCVNKLKPTPTKSHYIFNLRDLSKFVIGICRVDKSKVHSENIGRLWAHEARRVFVDRLLPEDKQIIEKAIEQIGKKWGKNMNQVYFSDILSQQHDLSYQQINDLQKINLTVATALNNYNLVSDKPMDLVLFNYALQHILIILRIIRQPKGNALLVGLGGSGRKSFSYLAAFIAQYTTYSLQITTNYNSTQFKEDMKKMCLQIGIKNKSISFIFTDSMIKDQQFLEDINNILNIGYIPNLYTSEEKIEICENIGKDADQQAGRQLNLDQKYQYFLQRIANKLKLVLCFSPIGQAFRARIRMFPSLINCTTVDWYNQWPQNGLLSVAKQFLNKTQLKPKDNYIKMFQYLHSSAKKWSQTFYQELKRKFYVTPTSFIEFITTFKSLLSTKRRQIKQLIYKYENGYSKIVQTEKQVEEMKKSLQEMKPEIKKAAEDTTMKMELVQIQKQEADQIMLQVSSEEKVVLQAVNQANQIKEDCQKELAVALPQLKAAQNALMVLDKSSLTQLKSMNNPPLGVRLTLQGLCLLIQPNPKQKMKNDKTLKMQTDWWSASMRLLNNPKLLNQLINFNKESLTENIINNLGKFLNDPNNKETLTVANVAKSSLACQCIIQWVIGIYNFYFVNKKVKPKKQSLRQAEIKADVLNKKLDAKRAELQNANQKVDQLNYQLQWAQKNKARLEKQYAQCQISLQRAEIIMKSLGSQKQRWFALSQSYKEEAEKVDCVAFMCAAQIIYFGPFTQAFRARILKQWLPAFKQNKLEISHQFSFTQSLGKPVKIRNWNSNGLPFDNYSVENALILYNSRRWPLMIDPQGQANKWLKKQQLQRKIKVTKPFEDNFIRSLENCIQFGHPALIENLGQDISAALTPILLKQTYKKGATTYLKMGQNLLIYSQDFFLYMTTKLSNPHYLPQVCTQVVLINFMITEQGLNDQLLALIVSIQRPDLQKQKQKLTLQSASNKNILLEIQTKILDILGNCQNILGDQSAIQVLSASKDKANQIEQKQIFAQETQKQIDKARSQYQDLARQGSILFFVVSSLENLDAMYRYSLMYFTDLYRMAVMKAEQADQKEERLKNIQDQFRISLYRNIGRSLFQKDRLIFSIIMALKLQKIPNQVIQYLYSNNDTITPKSTLPKINQKWLTQKMWKNLLKIQQIPEFQTITLLINDQKNKQYFHTIINSQHPFAENLPTIYQSYQFVYKLVLWKCLRPDKMVEGFMEYIVNSIGHQFGKALPFDLSKIYPDSTASTPIMFILSPGSDPFISITNYSKVQDVHMDSISLGQGQGPLAQKLIAKYMQKGGWVVLQNCHLATSWMPTLQKIIEQLQDPQKQINKKFRLWLTSYPSQQFPQSILQKSLKITNQPAKGLKNNLMVSYLSDPINNPDYFSTSLYEKPFKKLLFSLSFFHAVIQQRKKYGSLGWNILYQFNQSDLRISCKQLKIYIDSATIKGMGEKGDKEGEQGTGIPFQILSYVIAECNYGGRVTDQNDRRLLVTLLKEIFCEGVVKDERRCYGNTEEYVLPEISQYQQYLTFIDNLPQFSSPQIVGLHPNADITKDFNQSNQILDSLLQCLSSTNNSIDTSTQQSHILQLIQTILQPSKFPQQFNIEQILKKYPILYQQSMNTVLNQEIGRYNRLICQIRNSLLLLTKAIKGQQVMTVNLEKMYRAMLQGKIPQLWLTKSYPSLKPLASYIKDLQNRIKFFQKWVNKGRPSQFWISGFFFTQSFLTGILQNYSRKKSIPVDQLSFNFIFQQQKIKQSTQGVNIYGLYIEGASWDHSQQILSQSKTNQLYVQCPNIYLKPQHYDCIDEENKYQAPLYKTTLRRGVLSTTGHSTNFVMMIRMPTRQVKEHWIKRGTALLTQINL